MSGDRPSGWECYRVIGMYTRFICCIYPCSCISHIMSSRRDILYSIQVVMVIYVVYQSEFINIICYYCVGILVSLYVIICLECGALPMSLPAVQFRTHLGAGFTEKYHVSPLSSQHAQSLDIVSMLCPWASHFTLRCFT